MDQLGGAESSELRKYAVLTFPENVRRMSLNLRTPILVNPQARLGIQEGGVDADTRPVRCFIYHDPISSRPEDKVGTLIMHRKKDETIEIGEEVSVQVLDFCNGGVRLGVSAPKHLPVLRGKDKATPEEENLRASRSMDARKLETVIRMHRVMEEPDEVMRDALALEQRNNFRIL